MGLAFVAAAAVGARAGAASAAAAAVQHARPGLRGAWAPAPLPAVAAAAVPRGRAATRVGPTMETLVWAPVGSANGLVGGTTVPFEAVGLSLTLVPTVCLVGTRGRAGGDRVCGGVTGIGRGHAGERGWSWGGYDAAWRRRHHARRLRAHGTHPDVVAIRAAIGWAATLTGSVLWHVLCMQNGGGRRRDCLCGRLV